MKPNGMHFPFGPFLWQTTLDIDVVDDLLDKTKNTIKYHNDKYVVKEIDKSRINKNSPVSIELEHEFLSNFKYLSCWFL